VSGVAEQRDGSGGPRFDGVAVDTVFAYVNGFAIEEQARDGFPAEPERRALRDKTFQAGLDLIIAGVTASRS
jgi:TetR/AcrR family tetracycline transcriptional repressor